MALFKCKMCGGDLEVAEGITIVECDYCGTQQTVPSAMDENLQNLFNRANTLRIKSEFDKAEKLYEKIIQSDSTQSDAYWGLILCKYGIEYVDDPATFKKIPTCHRASYDSIIADDDYKSALEHADLSQRALYEEQAKEIDRIQRDILALAQKEETYDVFICYKETDADGKRTQDSVIANDIYYQLTQEGFKVFYASITLEGKLGSAYEPIIFAALNSAKVMLSIGTKPEYFNAVWVKNEWSRFLKIIKNDRSKLLIPCYRDMDAYELPEEFAHLQAQDMAKIGFVNDLVRGIRKVMPKDEPQPTTVVKENVVTAAPSANASTAPLLKRAFMFLEDGEWERADDFCEQVLNQDPENAQAYLGKLMAELRVKTQESLKDQAEPFDYNNNYQKAIRFADEKLKSTLIGYIEYINTRNENARLDGIYSKAKNAMAAARTESAYKEAAHLFETVSEYLDAATLAQTCYEKAEVARKDAILSEGKFRMAGEVISNCEAAVRLFESIPGWKDADELLRTCEQKIEDLKVQAVLAKQEAERLAEEKKIAAQKAALKLKKRRRVIALVLAVIILLSGTGAGVWYYNSPLSMLDYTRRANGNIRIDGIKSDRAIVDGVVTIPESILGARVTDIGPDAFANGQIKEVVLPKSILYFSYEAFEGAYGMQKISYAGTAAEWRKVFGVDHSIIQNFEVTHTGDCIPVALNAVAPTCTATGLSEGQICRVCKKVVVAQTEIPATGHTSVTDIGTAPTCTENGISDGSHCVVCGEVLVAQEELLALNPAGHTWKFSEVLSVATCTETGTEKFVCEMCGVEESRTVSGHEFDDWKTVAMCAEEENRTCTLCGTTESRRIAPLTAHNYVNAKCTVCGAYKPSEGLEFSDDGVVLGMGTCQDTVLVIPAVTPDGVLVTEIGRNAFSRASITSVIIPNSVTTIGINAFFRCAALKNVTIGNSVTKIGDKAFYDCGALTSITIPDSVTKIGEWAFSNCDALKSITIPDSVTTIYNGAFYSCSALTNVTISNSVTILQKDTFYDCDALKNITIPDSVTTIGDNAFGDCDALKSITIPDSVTTIGEWAFFDCNALTSVTFGNSVTTIGGSAFYSCDVLPSVTIPNSVTTIGDSAFANCGALKSVTIPNSVTTIDSWVFANCGALKSVTIPNSVTTICRHAFYWCKALTSITIPDSVTTIGEEAFFNCDALKVIYNGTKQQLKEISYSSSSFMSGVVAACSDGNLKYNYYGWIAY